MQQPREEESEMKLYGKKGFFFSFKRETIVSH